MPRVRGADDLEQLLPEHEGDDETDARQRHAEARHVGGHAQVAVESELAAARDGVAVHHGDGGVSRALDAAEHLDDAALGIGSLGTSPRLHLLEIHARAEGGAGATDHDHADVAMGVQLLKTLAERGEQGAVHGIALAGAVEGDGGDATVHRAEDFV